MYLSRSGYPDPGEGVVEPVEIAADSPVQVETAMVLLLVHGMRSPRCTVLIRDGLMAVGGVLDGLVVLKSGLVRVLDD